MKKLQIYNLEKAMDFFLDAVLKKRSSQYNQWPSTVLKNQIRALFDDYDIKLKSNTLEQLPTVMWQGVDTKNFEDLYSFRAAKFKKLYQFLTTTPQNVVDKVCPYCFLDSSGTLDHFVPKTPFPHFSANPQNLIPCCPKCNSNKNDDWRENQGGKIVRLFLNAYIDDVMNQNFLEVRFSYPGNNIVPSFLISQNGMLQDLFDIVKSHFDKLDLATRYRESSNKVIVELGNSIKASRRKGLGDQMIKEINLDAIAENEKTFGLNHWETVLKKACITDPVAYNYLITH